MVLAFPSPPHVTEISITVQIGSFTSTFARERQASLSPGAVFRVWVRRRQDALLGTITGAGQQGGTIAARRWCSIAYRDNPVAFRPEQGHLIRGEGSAGR
jgi:hypothetical protein